MLSWGWSKSWVERIGLTATTKSPRRESHQCSVAREASRDQRVSLNGGGRAPPTHRGESQQSRHPENKKAGATPTAQACPKVSGGRHKNRGARLPPRPQHTSLLQRLSRAGWESTRTFQA